MRKNIIWVDEDKNQLALERALLTGRGFNVVTIENASKAYERLKNINGDNVQLVILDVMLEGGSNERFSMEATSEGDRCGVILAELLLLDVKWMRGRTIFYTQVSDEEQMHYVKKRADNMNIIVGHKDVSLHGNRFLTWLEENGLIPRRVN